MSVVSYTINAAVKLVHALSSGCQIWFLFQFVQRTAICESTQFLYKNPYVVATAGAWVL